MESRRFGVLGQKQINKRGPGNGDLPDFGRLSFTGTEQEREWLRSEIPKKFLGILLFSYTLKKEGRRGIETLKIFEPET